MHGNCFKAVDFDVHCNTPLGSYFVIASTFIIFWKINCFLSFSDICMYMYTCYFVFSLYAYILHPTLLLDNMLIKILYVIRAKHHHV